VSEPENPFSGYYRLVEMSGFVETGEPLSVTYDAQMIETALGTAPQEARGYVFFDEATALMDLRMTVLTNGIPAGIIQGEGNFAVEEDGAKVVLNDFATWVYTAEPTEEGLVLTVDTNDARNESKQKTLTRYSFVKEPLPEIPFVGDWTLSTRETESSELSSACGLEQDLFILKLYGTADGSFSLNARGGMALALNLVVWESDDTCSSTPTLELYMNGSGLCEVKADESWIGCSYNRVDQNGSEYHFHYEGQYSLDGDALSIDVSSFKSDTTDPKLLGLTYTRGVESL